jgi:hypothetical protein
MNRDRIEEMPIALPLISDIDRDNNHPSVLTDMSVAC